MARTGIGKIKEQGHLSLPDKEFVHLEQDDEIYRTLTRIRTMARTGIRKIKEQGHLPDKEFVILE